MKKKKEKRKFMMSLTNDNNRTTVEGYEKKLSQAFHKAEVMSFLFYGIFVVKSSKRLEIGWVRSISLRKRIWKIQSVARRIPYEKKLKSLSALTKLESGWHHTIYPMFRMFLFWVNLKLNQK